MKCVDLQQELDNAKNTLVTLNDNIRRVIGRNPNVNGSNKNDKHKIQHDVKRGNSDNQDQKLNEPSTKHKRHNNNFDGQSSVFKRLSAPSNRSFEEESRPRLSSRVIRELPSRQEIVAAQGNDSESRARNRRMFGSLMGTLHKFCQEESRLKPKEDKKAQIEKKLEDQEIRERENLRKERELLFTDRKKKKLEIKILELKMSRLKDFEHMESSMAHLKHHIRTKTKPPVYFKPRILCNKTEKLLSESRIHLESTIESKRQALNRELIDLENNLRMNEDDNTTTADDHCEIVVRNEDKIDIIHVEEVTNKRNSVPELNEDRTGEYSSKENISRKLNEPGLISSIVVVKSESKY